MLLLTLPGVCYAAPEEVGSVVWVDIDNGVVHLYKIYAAPGIDWDSASSWVSNTLGNEWYLATITSAAEQLFFEASILPFLPDYNEFWLGAFQNPLTTSIADQNWQWVTSESWLYTNWAPGEPNDGFGPGTEQHLAIYSGGWNDEGYLPNIYGFVAETTMSEITVIPIDIRPGGFPNSINPFSKGVIPVAIMSTPNFDAMSVDTASVRFGISGTEAVARHFAFEDVDGDNDLDMILHFNTEDTNISCGSMSAVITGMTLDGHRFMGMDSVHTVGCKK
jgi:hypothetical protein